MPPIVEISPSDRKHGSFLDNWRNKIVNEDVCYFKPMLQGFNYSASGYVVKNEKHSPLVDK